MSQAPQAPRRISGTLVIVLVLFAGLATSLGVALMALQTRYVVQIEALHQRVSELERRAGIAPPPLPSKEAAEAAE